MALHPPDGHLETSAADRDRLLDFWRKLAPLLHRFDPAATLPEVLNEPVFPGDPTGRARLQHAALLNIRSFLPASTVVLAGADWGSATGLIALTPEADPNVIYSFHLYEPAELTSLGAYRPGINAAALAQLPFPVADRAACEQLADTIGDCTTADLMRFYCAQG